MTMLWVWSCVFWCCVSVVHAGKVLVFPVDGSHWVNMRVIIEELHSRGHQVSVLRLTDSWYIKETSPFYTSITVNMRDDTKNMIASFVSKNIEIKRGRNPAWLRFIYHGVPVVGLPLFFDQYDNLLCLQVRGGAEIISVSTVDKDDNFLKAIQEVLTEPSYRMNMQRLSRLHRDQPVKPMDKALFWIEFVMRHKGAAHLKAQSYNMSWFSYHSVDVVLFLTAAVLLVLLTSFMFIRCLFRAVCKRKVKSD